MKNFPFPPRAEDQVFVLIFCKEENWVPHCKTLAQLTPSITQKLRTVLWNVNKEWQETRFKFSQLFAAFVNFLKTCWWNSNVRTSGCQNHLQTKYNLLLSVRLKLLFSVHSEKPCMYLHILVLTFVQQVLSFFCCG